MTIVLLLKGFGKTFTAISVKTVKVPKEPESILLKSYPVTFFTTVPPDFTESLIWETLNESQKNEFRKQGVLTIPNPYNKTKVKYPFQLIQEAKKHLILENDIRFYGRAILHHGLLDKEVPWQTSLEIAEKLCSNNVKIQLDKTANHRYSDPEQINSLINSLEELTS